LFDPGANQRNLFAGKWIALFGHAWNVFATAIHRAKHEALRGLSGDNWFSVLTAFEGVFRAIPAQTVLLPVGAMALVTVLREDWLNISGEIDLALFRERRNERGRGQKRSEEPGHDLGHKTENMPKFDAKSIEEKLRHENPGTEEGVTRIARIGTNF
jgi:hypothetical protein